MSRSEFKSPIALNSKTDPMTERMRIWTTDRGIFHLTFAGFASIFPKILTIGLVLIFSSNLSAQFPFEEARPLYTGARPLGMGNAFTAIADDATAGFWNPAGLPQWTGVKLFGSNKFHDRSNYAFDPKGIAYSYRRLGLFWGNKIALGVESGTPDFNYYGFGYQMGAYFSGGLNIKFKRKHPSDYYQFFGSHPSYDVAVLLKPHTNLKFGLLAQHLPQARGIQWLTIGAAYRRWNLLFATDIAIPRLGGPDFYLGIEWRMLSFVRMRGGYSDKDWTGGLGFDWKMGQLDYARIHDGDFTSHFISAGLKL